MTGLYEAVDSITKKKQRENLINYRDQAFLSRDLVTIDTKVPVSGDLSIFEIGPPDREQLSVLWETAFPVESAGWQVRGLTDNYLRVVARAPERLWNMITPVRLTALRDSGMVGMIVGRQ